MRTEIRQNNQLIECDPVRPDGLINANKVTDYLIHPSPIRNAIFNTLKTSRINVGEFMDNLITNYDLRHKRKVQIPVIDTTSSLD